MSRKRKNKKSYKSNFGNSDYKNRKKSSNYSSNRKKSSRLRGVSKKLQLESRSLKERLALIILSAGTIFAAGLVFITIIFSMGLPNVSDPKTLLPTESTVFFDRNGKVIHTVRGEEDRENIKSEDIPQVVKDAAIAIEDDQFYKHNGFDLPALTKAVLSEVGIGKPRGGSTITQQFIKNAVLSSERTYTRKLKELVLAVQLERHFTKDEILTLYLNRIPYGGTAYGVEKAAEVFFDKDARDLNLVEAAVLASLPNAPTYYSPYGNHKHTTLDIELTADEASKVKSIRDLADDEYTQGLLGKTYTLANGENLYLPGRVDSVLLKMEELNFITNDERQEAIKIAENYEFNVYTSSRLDTLHFVNYVSEILNEKYGDDFVQNGGLKITTTLDLEAQQSAQEIVDSYSAQHVNKFKANNAALVSVLPETGEVIAMIGNSQIEGEEFRYFNVATSDQTQVGSTIKPLVYAAGFSKTLPSPGSTIFDVPIKKAGGKFRNNFDGKFNGPMSVRESLAQSRNMAALKMYSVAGGQEELITYMEKLGIKSLKRTIEYGDSLALGAAEIPMVEMLQAYSVFPNEGKFVEINPILEIKDDKGEIIEDNRQREELINTAETVISEEEAFMINDILSDQSVNFGELQALPSNRPVASKTGTSTNENGDPVNLWTIGYTKQKLTAVWVGNSSKAEGSSFAVGSNGTGYGAAMPIWNKFMVEHTKDDPIVGFEAPSTVKKLKFSKLSGNLPSKNTPANMIGEDYFMPELTPVEVDNSYYKSTVDVRNNKKTNKYCPDIFVKQVTFWNHKDAETFSPENVLNLRHSEILNWFNSLTPQERGEFNLGEGVVIGYPIDEVSDNCKRSFAERSRNLEIINIDDGTSYPAGEVRVELKANAASGIDKIEFYMGDSLQYTAKDGQTFGFVRLSPALQDGTEQNVRVILYDTYGYSVEDQVEIMKGEREETKLGDFNFERERSVVDPRRLDFEPEDIIIDLPVIDIEIDPRRSGVIRR